ncbi:TELO2-interacting protein 2 isoform X2 [Tiliqua scincoides]|uniref:TELO2-interacting protein 2 isoform X2 n=1 Tax=Tiliqua scincoides TaxID=71010 RepID=UPI003462927D
MEQHHLWNSLQLDSLEEGEGFSKCPPVDQVLLQFLQLFASKGVQGAGSRAKAGMVRDLLAILEVADGQWLWGGCPPNTTLAALRDLVAALSQYAAPPRQEPDGEGHTGSETAVYAATADQAADVGLVFCSILAKVEAARGLEEPGTVDIGSVLHKIAGPLYVFAVTHAAEKPWSKPRSQTVAQELLGSLLQVSGCPSVPEFLRGSREGNDGWFAVVMRCLKPELTKETWQHNPAMKYVFSWTLQQVTRPWLGQHFESVLPPSLLLSDDYRTENKILGVQCLHHIIRNVPAADLYQFNRGQVVYHALFNHLYSKEAQPLQVVLPCLLDLLPILEKAPQQPARKSWTVTPLDKVLRLVLTHMEVEHQLALRRVYAKSLPAFVERLSIRIACHLKRLQQVIIGYLEVADGPEEEARLAILETLKQTIKHAWPRPSCKESTAAVQMSTLRNI